MVVLGIWAALIGYTVVYAGLCNWQNPNASISLPDSFLGQKTCTCAGKGAGPQIAAPDVQKGPLSYDMPLWSVAA